MTLGSKIQEAFAPSQQRRLQVGPLRSQPRLNSEQFKLQKDGDGDYVYGYTNTPPSGGSASRQLNANRQLNQLKMKADELEKLFAEHKLRAPRDQPNPTRHTNIADVESDHKTRSSCTRVVPDGHSLLQPSFQEFEFSDDSRGKSYDSYMKKRNARLTELWDSNGVEKEAKMKEMHDILERHSNEMKARLSWSADKQNSASRRAESLSARSALKREELHLGPLQADGDVSGFGVSRNIQGKTSLPRTLVAATPRSTTKLASTSGQQPDNNPLAQSVPNFSDLRKENTKHYSTATQAATRSHLRNCTHSRSSNGETPSVKDDKSQRSQSLRKTLVESSDGAVLTQSKNVEPKRFLRKNTAKLKPSMASEAMNKEEEDEPPSVVKDDFNEAFDKTETEYQVVDVVDGIESRMSNESEKLMDSESEHGNTSQSFSQVDHSSVAELPGESPMSWNSHTDYPSSYAHEASDFESPMRSPASWNLHRTESTAVDGARIRKKWGITQKPNLLPSSSDLKSHKDTTKGFKRLLKFGRKSRHTENLVDYISATTSEGDDETEDGRDPANRSSEDLRKSRMGYSHGLAGSDSYGDEVHASQSSMPTPPANFRIREDHLSGSSIKAPRSFFSLSTFRSKGSEPKPR